MAPSAAIVIPTKDRPDYLDVTLCSLAPQAAAAGVEVVVVDDSGAAQSARSVCERHRVRHLAHPRPLGLNAARNSGIDATAGEIVVFIDDDVVVDDGWLAALLAAAEAYPAEQEVFTGPIHARLEGRPPRSCGREQPPITALDLGPADTRTRFAWGVNMAIRRSAFDRVGPFDPTLHGGGDEQEWQERLAGFAEGDTGGEGALYVAAASLTHRRAPQDARLAALMRACYGRGRASRRFDARRNAAPSRSRETATLLGCLGHVVRYRCPNGLTMAAHSAGRLREAIAAAPRGGGAGAGAGASAQAQAGARTLAGASAGAGKGTDTGAETETETRENEDFLSGESGTVAGRDGLRRELADRLDMAAELASGRRLRLRRAARTAPPRRDVLALCIARPQRRALADRIARELAGSRHRVALHLAPPGEKGKFENLNALLAAHPATGHDWLIVLDDDVELPRGFLDRFLFLCERFDMQLAQPAHLRASHAAWQVTRRRRDAVARQTAFVEIGPLTAFSRQTFETLLPFPALRMGWGLDAHWAAVAAERGWRCGVIDAVPIRHRAAPAAHAYSRESAIREARAFLSGRPYVKAEQAQRTLVAHRRW